MAMRQGDVMEKMETGQLVSALVDGDLQGEDFARGVQVMAGDAVARQIWQDYHLIGEILRSGDRALGPAVGNTSGAFMTRMSANLAKEPGFAPTAAAIPIQALHTVRAPAANDSTFRWKMVAGVASMAAVAAIGWSAVGGMVNSPAQGQLALGPQLAQPDTVLVGSNGGPMIRDARLDELLAAHRQLGGASALQMPSGFLRNATFDGPAR